MTCVIFHANAMVGLDMFDHANFYSNQGFDVLVVTMGGYGDSEGTAGEVCSYHDALAAVRYCTQVLNMQPGQLVLHGLSLGGALATAAALVTPGAHVVLDQTFTSAQQVALAVVSAQANWVPEWAKEQATAALFQGGISVDGALITDGYDTVAKLAQVQGQVFVFSASEDDMMPDHFGAQLVAARYGDADVIDSRHAVLYGPHAVFFGRDQPGAATLIRFLDDISSRLVSDPVELHDASEPTESGGVDQIRLGAVIPYDEHDVDDAGGLQGPVEPFSLNTTEGMSGMSTAKGGTNADGKWLI